MRQNILSNKSAAEPNIGTHDSQHEQNNCPFITRTIGAEPLSKQNSPFNYMNSLSNYTGSISISSTYTEQGIKPKENHFTNERLYNRETLPFEGHNRDY